MTSNFIFQLNTCGYSPYVTYSLIRGWVCHLQLLLVIVSAVILRSESRGTHGHILLSLICDSHNLVGQVPVFMLPWHTVARLYPQALGSLFATSYDLQGYGGGIRPHLHMGWLSTLYVFVLLVLIRQPWHGSCRKHRFQQFFHCCMHICISIAVGVCLPSYCLTWPSSLASLFWLSALISQYSYSGMPI
jgi:hypothetical protein